MNVYSMDDLSKHLKKNTSGVKGSSSSNPNPNEQEEEAANKAKEESAHRLETGAKNILVEEK